jgi:hypothetical protein
MYGLGGYLWVGSEDDGFLIISRFSAILRVVLSRNTISFAPFIAE